VHHEDQHYAARLLATASLTDRGATRRQVRHCCREERQVHCGGSSRYEAAQKKVAEMLFQKVL